MTAKVTRREERLYEALRPVVEPLGVSLIDVEVRQADGEARLRVVIDDPDGVSTGVCERVSNHVRPVLDVEETPGQYDALEVTSPGVRRRLRRPDEYERFAGRDVVVTCYAPFRDRKQWRGTLRGGTNDGVRIDPEDAGPVDIPEDRVASVRLYFDAEAALQNGGHDR